MKMLISFIVGITLGLGIMYIYKKQADAECIGYMLSLGTNCTKVIDGWIERSNKYEKMYKQMEAPCNTNINIISKLKYENAALKEQLKQCK